MRPLIEWMRKQPAAVRAWSTRRLFLFGASSDDPLHGDLDGPLLRRNHWPDLEAFEQTERWLTREAFLRTARRRLDDGEDVYTLVESDRLVCYGWLKRDCRQSRYGYVDQSVTFPPGTAVIYNGYVHPAARGRRLHGAAQQQRIADAFAEGGRFVISAVEAPNRAAQKSAERAGLRLQALLETRMRLGSARKTAHLMPGAFPIGVDAATSSMPTPAGGLWGVGT